MKERSVYVLAIAVALLAIGCVVEPEKRPTSSASNSSSPAATPSQSTTDNNSSTVQSLTLPVLDAFFADESFSGLLKTRLQLTDDQVRRLRELARSETARLNEANTGTAPGETAMARADAEEKIRSVIGEEKTRQLTSLIYERWSDTNDSSSEKTSSRPTGSKISTESVSETPNAVPADSRVVVNAPSYRMDVFDAGRLIKSYKIGIGYPQFPLPTGLRKARTIIFNPTWTPPDEPWVAKMKNINVGEKVEAGSKLNPLGPIKIPIGGPSLIHGGKPVAKLGTFASHGCVGLTTAQVNDFARLLAKLGGARLTDAELVRYARDKSATKELRLSQAVPVELRYETIVAEDGKLHIYRDVYDQNTNTEDNLRAVLEANAVRLEDLTAEERAQVLDALALMAGRSSTTSVRSSTSANQNSTSSGLINPSVTITGKARATQKTSRLSKNQNEIVIDIAALRGKGYPAPANLDTGAKRATP